MFYEASGRDDEALMSVFKNVSGQQINLPVHLYEPEEKASQGQVVRDAFEVI